MTLYDLEAFFEAFDFLKISSIALAAKLNESLVRQYATGKKHASKDQVKKIEDVIHSIGQQLQKVELV